MMVDRTADRAPHLCTPPGRFPGGRGEALAAIFSRPPAARTGTGRHRARPARVVAGVDQRPGSCPRSRRAGGRGGDVAGAGLDRASRAWTGPWRCPSAGRSTRPSPWTGLDRGGRSSRCAAAAGAVRAPSAGGEAGRGCGMTSSSSVIMADLTTPTSWPRAAARSCRLRRVGTLSFRPSGHPAPLPRQGAPLAEGLLMAPVGRRVLLTLAAASQSGSLGRATDQGRRLPVDLLEDRPLSRRRPPAGR